ASLALGAAPRRERLLSSALAAWCNRDPLSCLRALRALVAAHPRDLLALELLHATLLVFGEAGAMRSTLEAAVHAWDETIPGYAYVLGCLAFARQEVGDYAAAERAGRRAVELEPLDAWGGHAVANVMEAQDRVAEGIAWLRQHQSKWIYCDSFFGHTTWQLAIFHVARGENDEALDLYDTIAAEPDGDYRDLANASTLLYRLERSGVDVASRWPALGERALLRIDDYGSAFAAPHYALALTGAGLIDEAARLCSSIRLYSGRTAGHEALTLREVSLPLAQAIVSMRDGLPGPAARAFVRVQPHLPRLGGSRAQRDIFDVLALDASMDAKDDALARTLIAARLAA
ncbi:MAG: hypothetical protein K8H88_02495, partial [Sandaracinaceae bacterium]|nr:hypothetical protein [Sandaracinaceae bacterium]